MQYDYSEKGGCFMAANYTGVYVLNANIEHICALIRDVHFYNSLQLKFKSEIPMQGGACFQFSSGVNLSSWGEKIDISVLYLNETSSQITIKSECALPTQIIDWGKNKSNAEKIYSNLLMFVSNNQNLNGATYQQTNNQNLNNEQPEQVTKSVFCTKCGTQLNSGANFCHLCGTKVH